MSTEYTDGGRRDTIIYAYDPRDQAAAQVPEQGLTDKIGQRLATLTELIGDTNATLGSLSDRVLGPIPRGISGGAGAANKPSGRGSEIIDTLDRLLEMAQQGRDEARNLNSRI